MKLLLLAGFCASTVLCFAALAACASDDSSTSPSSSDTESDASSDATKPKADGGDTGTADASTCEQTKLYMEACAQEPTCGDDFDRWCADNDRAINSETFRRAEAQCLTKANCDGNDRRDCEYRSYASATPTATQAAIVDAYCATCEPSDTAGCAKTQTTYNTALGPKSVSDLFVAAWELADPLVEEIRKKCTGSALNVGPADAGDEAAACAKAFSLCAGGLYIGALPDCPKESLTR